MVHAPTPLRRLLVAVALTTAAASSVAAESPIQTPTLSRAWPDRVDVGDTVTLVGTQLDEAGTTLAVTLGTGLACPVTRRTDNAVDITVPAGARSGYVAVTVTKQLPDGTSVSVSSNGVPLLVVWTFFDTTGLGPYGSYVIPDNVVAPGPADSVDICFGGWDYFGRVEADLYSVRHDRSVAMVGRNYQDWLSGSRVAIDPLSGEVVAAVTVSQYGSFTQYLENFSTGATLFQFPNDPQGATLMPMAVRFDSSGALYVAVVDEAGLTRIFHFRPGDPITFDFNSPSCRIPNGVALQDFCFHGADMAVGGDGTVVYTPCALVEAGQSGEILRVPGRDGAVFEKSQLPDLHYTEGTLWYLGARCNGQTLAAGASWGGDSPVSLVDLTDGSVIATITGLTRLRGFGTDGYDNLYVHGLFPVGGRYRWGLRRLTVADLPAGFYGTPPPGATVATQRASALFDAPADPATIPPEWLVKRRQPPNVPQFRLKPGEPGPKAANNPEIARAHGTAAALQPVALPRHAAATSLTLPAVPPDTFCASSVERLLKVKIVFDPDQPESGANFQWLESDGTGNAVVPILFGQAPTLTAYLVAKDDVNNANPVDTQPTWEIVAGSESVNGVQPGSLYPTKPEILFNDAPQLARQQVRLQTVHIGAFKIKVGPPPGQTYDPLTIEVDEVWPFGLGQNPVTKVPIHPEYDSQILDAANSFGIPPQYIKGQVQREAKVKPDGTWDAQSYRYEMRKWDEFDAYAWDDTTWANPAFEYYRYRFPQSLSGTSISGSDIAPRDRFQVISHFDTTLIPPAWPYLTRFLTTSEDPVLAWSLYEANDGWPCRTYSWSVYNAPTACGTPSERFGPTAYTHPQRRERWFARGEVEWLNFYRASGRFYCGLTNEPVECLPSEAWWLVNAGMTGYAAQTAIAASYGLLQVHYTLAVDDMAWNAGQSGDTRHPSSLFDPAVSLNLGAGYDARQTQHYAFNHDDSPGFATIADYIAALVTGFGHYNGGGVSRPTYGQAVIANAKAYKPY